MATHSESIPSGDGRNLDVLIGGAATGPALVLHHGTPGDATNWSDWDDLARANGLRLVSVSRPGYASSSRKAKRAVADAAADISVVLERLKVPWFVTAGWSGGGPHALACAALLGKRCHAAATLAGVAIYDGEGLDFLEGMGPENIDEFGAALSSEDELREWLERNCTGLREINGRGLANALGGLVTPADVAVLNAGYAEQMAASIRRALGRGFDGWIDDDLAFVSDWGFALTDIDVPVTVWQGDTDLMVPHAHGVWLQAQIPGALGKFVPGDGHISIAASHREDVLADLLSHA